MLNALFELATELDIRYLGSQRTALLRSGKGEEAQITRFEKELENGLFSYRVISGHITNKNQPHVSFVVNVGTDYVLIKYVNGTYYDNKGSTSLEPYLGCRYFILREVVKKNRPGALVFEIIKLTPVISTLLLLLTPIALVTPLYTNIFNTRIVHSNSITTLFIVAIFFFGIYLLEFFCKKVIKVKCMKINTSSSLLVERYIVKFTPHFKSFSAVNSAKTIEQYRKTIWEFIPTIATDITTFIILFIAMSVFLSWLIIYFFIFYIIIFFIFYFYRTRLYQHLIEKEKASADVLKQRISNYNNRDEIPFTNRFILFRKYLSKYSSSQFYEDKITDFNFYWDELTKIISFVALTLLFAVSFIGVSTSQLNPAYMIVLFIISSRLSGLVSQITTRLSYLRVGIFHIKQSIESLFEDETLGESIDDVGVTLEDVNQIKITDLGIAREKAPIIQHANLKFNKGIIYGVKGPVGCGKSTFVRTLIGLNKEFEGKIEYDGIDLNTVDTSFFEKNVSYLNAETPLFNGTLFDNFLLHNCANNKAIEYILREAFGSRVFDYQTLYIQDVDRVFMSTGQRRKLLFLLTIFNRSTIYVFDEPLVNLSQSDILKSINLIRQNSPNAIIILISHNESILNSCDMIYEIKHNTINVASDENDPK